MVRLTPLCLLTTLLAISSSVLAQASNDDPRGKELYVNYPSCDYWKCEVIWHPNQSVYVNWLNAPPGGLRILLAPTEDFSLPTYTLTEKVGSVHGWKDHKCSDMGTGEKCGRFDWTVPSNVRDGKYQIEVYSLGKRGLVGYTDTVVVKRGGKKGKRHEVNRMDLHIAPQA